MLNSRLFFFVIGWFLSLSSLSVKAGISENNISNFEVAHVTPITLTSDESQLIAVNTPNASIELYSIISGQLEFIKSVKVGIDPVSVRLRNNSEAWVVNNTSDSISIVDLNSAVVTNTLFACDEPGDVVFAGDHQEAFVSCAGSEEIVVFDAVNPTKIKRRIHILGEQPRAMAVSPDGSKIYLGIFESGNGTTILSSKNNSVETNIGNNPDGPYGGQIPFPNDGDQFNPPLNPANPAPSSLTSIIVKRTSDGRWLDDNNGDWTNMVTQGWGDRDRIAGWDLIDRDVAVIDVNSNDVSYVGGMLNIVMGLAVNPQTGRISVVGTEALNQIRFEPVLNGKFIQVLTGSFDPGGATSISDLNSHLTYSEATLPVSEREKSIGDPRGIAWTADGKKAFVTGMGSNNVIVINEQGQRVGRRPTIEVGEGPTGIIIADNLHKAFVLNRFEASISTIDLDEELEVARMPLSVDPTPEVIKLGRPMLYDTHRFSGTGHTSCASCHVDGKTDRLAWDLGDPAAEMNTVAGITHHPMKGPMLTQTFVDTMQSAFLHWRGDKPTLGHFASTYKNLQGDDEPGSDEEMAAMKDFLSTLRTPPNPYRNLDNSYPTYLELRGPNGTVLRTGNAVAGAKLFEDNCRSCHEGHTGRGQTFHETIFSGGQHLTPPRWQNFYKRDGLWFRDAQASTSGFGFQQDGTFDSTHNQTRPDDLMAFMYAFNGSFPYTPSNIDEHSISFDAHAAVGRQVTLNNTTRTSSTLDQLESIASDGDIELTAHACINGRLTGMLFDGVDTFQTDRLQLRYSLSTIKNMAAMTPVTFTAVRTNTGHQFALDQDSDDVLDGDSTTSTQQCSGGAIIDIDSDGVFDDADAFPNDPTETVDSDGDGVGDNSDPFPNDPTRPLKDSDHDGVADKVDLYPNDANRSTGIWREMFTGIDGVSVESLTTAANFPNNPSEVQQLNLFEGPTDIADYYGSRIHGIFYAPETGRYIFWVSGDDGVQLNLSTDSSSANKREIASVPGWTSPRQWDKFTEQQSVPINLVAGEAYYVEALHKEGYGKDNLTVAWQRPSNSAIEVIADEHFIIRID